ncbi:ABC transporter ATP-binding protein [Sphaerotilus mobilis]|uniref:Iron complex transport system ATP-binding protein n=1 Tax=Sphaerotilus mobilis TaxID=47994 RepID=A0A4Q7LFL3_9BURK|nr:ABC transporter ATP-binding protein [Sphaerotilus mobilis]RZS53305.1 iron complex transport system ATP-binding protein [Sphaerotilus mobilis]
MKIDVDGLAVRLGRRPVLGDISCTLQPGCLTALIGPNGSGKSTFMRALAGLLPHEGSIGFGATGTRRRPDRVGYMPQLSAGAVGLSVIEVVLLGRLSRLGWRVPPADLEACAGWLARLGLDALAHRPFDALSGGQRQKVMLAQALASESSLLLLDEPTSALDLRHQLDVLESVRSLTHERQLTTVAILHDLNAVARYADRVLVLANGQLVASGTPTEVLKPALLQATFGVQARCQADVDGLIQVIAIAAAPETA